MIISKTPLRMSFFGGGSDLASYYENSKIGYGSVISTSINMFIYITVNKRRDDKIRIVYFGNELVDSVGEVKHDIIRNALKLLDIKGGIEIFYTADISISSAGVGLSSSSALTVGVLHALHTYKNEVVSKETLAREAYYIERECIGQACGIQDQLAVSFGGFRRYRFYSNGEITAEPIACKKEYIKELKDSLLLYYMGATQSKRDSGKILKDLDKNNATNMERIDQLVMSVDRNYNSLLNGNIHSWGIEFDKAWAIKKELASGVSTKEIDQFYDLAKANGTVGGKILGAGGGGFMLLFVEKEKKEQLKEALSEYELVDFEFEAAGSQIIFID